MTMATMPGRDTRTRYQGVFARHQSACPASAADPGACRCKPRYYGVVWDRDASRPRKTRRFDGVGKARAAREDLVAKLNAGDVVVVSGLRLEEARDRFVAAARDGVALNKRGQRYKRRAVDDLESALRKVPDELTRRRLRDVRRGDVQRLVDELGAAGLSGSRIRSIANALRSLYRWAQDRELVDVDPAALVRLPAMNATPRDRVADPAEMAQLLAGLEVPDAMPYALAAYATARHQEIRALDWRNVNLDVGSIELAADEDARKPGGSWRVVPLVAPLRAMLRRAWLEQGRPSSGRVCPPRRHSASGMLALNQMQGTVADRWRTAGLKPIGLHEARHTAATWLDHAGVSPKVASQLMGHATPGHQAGAAPITLARYTHTLPGELERARDQLDAFLAERTKAATG